MLRLKLISLLGVLLLSCFTVCLPKASAESSPSSLFEKFYMVVASGSTDAVKNNEFSLGQVPYLYIKASSADLNWYSNLISTWTSSSYTPYYIEFPAGDYLYTTGQEAWIAFDAEYWEDIVETGDWNVTASISGYNGTTAFKVTSSPTVTPEPISAVLFLTGGAALFLRRRRGTVMKHEA